MTMILSIKSDIDRTVEILNSVEFVYSDNCRWRKVERNSTGDDDDDDDDDDDQPIAEVTDYDGRTGIDLMPGGWFEIRVGSMAPGAWDKWSDYHDRCKAELEARTTIDPADLHWALDHLNNYLSSDAPEFIRMAYALTGIKFEGTK